MEQQENIKDGYSICFNEWALDKNIKNELGLLLIISSLSAEKGYCWASNKYFSDLFQESEVNISRKLKVLEEKKYIDIDYKRTGALITDRKIRLTKMLTAINKNVNRTINKNVKENNINNLKNINIKNKEIYKEIINYLNLKTNSNYKYTTNKTQKLIQARINEGFNLEDFKKVIDKKTREWLKDKKMNMYLRPETLFGTKFESYLNSPDKELTTKDLEEYINVEEAFL